MNDLAKIQAAIKAPKGQYNKFGNYKYRSCEDIVEAAKPILNSLGYSLTLTDEIVNIGSRFYVKATAIISTEGMRFEATAFAREEETKKGMDGSQITGAASSYARKYALNGLLAIDDTKDADATNQHLTGKQIEEQDLNDELTEEQRDELLRYLNTSTYDETQKKGLVARIASYHTIEQFNNAKANLLQNQVGIDGVVNPSKKDINKHLKASIA